MGEKQLTQEVHYSVKLSRPKVTPERRSWRSQRSRGFLSLIPVQLFWYNLPPLTSLSLLLPPSIYKGSGSFVAVCERRPWQHRQYLNGPGVAGLLLFKWGMEGGR